MNMNTNIFGIIILTGYEYEHIRNIIVDQIRMYEYFSHEYLDIIIKKYFYIPWTVLEVIRFSLSENLAQNYAILPFQICIVEA